MSDDDLRRIIVEVLASHSRLGLRLQHVSCGCGWHDESVVHADALDRRYREHVADMVLVHLSEVPCPDAPTGPGRDCFAMDCAGRGCALKATR